MRRALISVTDKAGIVEFAKKLEELGIEIVSTGGTFKTVKEAGVNVISIDEVTGFPEILDGRVKTLHPKVHSGILYKRDNQDHVDIVKEYAIAPIDIVVVNLYDFEGSLKLKKSHADMIENIDIGGPSMIRSAAKNYKDVIVVVDVNDYDEVIKRIETDTIDLKFREKLAMKAFAATAYYDSMISRYFISYVGEESDKLTLGLRKEATLRYGENPHQGATLYNDAYIDSLLSSYIQLNGKELSFNNLNDLNGAIELVKEFNYKKGEFVAVAVKHATPCGVAVGKDGFEAYKKAYEADKLSIFGGIVAVNFVVDKQTATLMKETFLEVLAAPKFTVEALEILREKKNLRVLELDFDKEIVDINLKYISGKILIQSTDKGIEEKMDIVTDISPNQRELEDLEFAMKVCKHVKSNAIVLAKDKATVAIGCGQTSRVWALNSAINNYSNKEIKGSVMASDAFFPFADCVDMAAKHGITSIIQPGGAIRDNESIEACNRNGISMIFTGVRHFKH